jgi:RNA polymerase sigma-70 factor (ECF subfamily)
MEPITTQENQSALDEYRLVLAAQKGDLEAFNELVLMYQDAVYGIAYRILGEPDAAEDITQEVFLTAFRKFTTFRNGSFRSWLFRITTNACYDELRRRKRHPLLSIDSADGKEENPSLPYDTLKQTTSPEQICERRELQQAVQRALNELNPDQRAVVILIDLQEMDYEEAARILQVPVGTVKSRLARARERLRQVLVRQTAKHGSSPFSGEKIEEILSPV